MLEVLLKEVIEKNPALKSKLVSAVILGGNVIVPEGKTEGGTFQNTPLCRSIVFDRLCDRVLELPQRTAEPVELRTAGKPARWALGGGSSAGGEPAGRVREPDAAASCSESESFTGVALSYYPTKKFPGLLEEFVQTPKASTPWVATPAEYTAQCNHSQRCVMAAAHQNPERRPAGSAARKRSDPNGARTSRRERDARQHWCPRSVSRGLCTSSCTRCRKEIDRSRSAIPRASQHSQDAPARPAHTPVGPESSLHLPAVVYPRRSAAPPPRTDR